MAYTLNRLEENWGQLLPHLKQEWNLLSDADWDFIDHEYDRLVDIIRQRYGGRTEIIQEAAIRDRLNQILYKIEI